MTRPHALVLVIGFAIGLLLVAMFGGSAVGLNMPTLALVIAALLWLLRVAPREDMLYSLAGIAFGAALALLNAVLALTGTVEPGLALVGVWLLLVSAA